MKLDTSLITKLREVTGAGISDCKAALEEAGNDMEKAIEFLRKRGALKAAKKLAEREAHEGLVDCYIHANGKIGVLIQVSCETDFVSRTADFKALVHDLAMQVAGANPLYVTPEQVPAEVLEKEKEIYREQLQNEKKPAAMMDKIIEGKLQKYFSDVCLLKQTFIKDDSLTIDDLIKQYVTKFGEKIEVIKFARYSIA